jgi:uncharacterized membrane protein
MITDLILAASSIGFLVADIKQVWKLFKDKNYDTSAFSKTHFRVKIISLMLYCSAIMMLQSYLAFSVAAFQLLLNIWIHNRIGWRHNKSSVKKSPIETDMLKKLWDNKYDDRWDDVDLYGGSE